MTAPQGPTALTLRFDPDSAGALHMTFQMPVMHCYGYQFEQPPVEVEAGEYKFDGLGMRWRLEADHLEGTFGLGHLPMELHRGGSFTKEPKAPKLPAGPAPLWTVDLGAPARSTPVVKDGVVYVGALNGRFHAVRASDGARGWMWEGPNPIDGKATVTDDRVYFVDRRFELVCLDRAFGTLHWRFPLHDSVVAGKPVPENPTFNRRTATPLVLDDVVYAGSSDGGLYAIEAATGAKRWRFDAGAPVFSGIARIGADTLAFGAMDGSIILIDRNGPRALTRSRTGGGVVTTPVVTADRIVAGSRDYQLYGFDRISGQPAWTYSYWFSWVESAPALADDTIYVGASDYRRITALDPENGRVRWATDVLGMTWGTPVVTPRRVYAATAAQTLQGTVIHHLGGIVALDRKSGAIKWRYATPEPPENSFGGFAGSLAFDHGRLFAAGFDGKLIALPAE